ncbi:MAG: cupin domain-containing protein [Bacteroidetes bacterium]|nr:cupin domain-containing protein [Bacteroidota bacterium]
MSDKFFIQKKPFVVPTTDGKHIAEHFGLASHGGNPISIAFMVAPPHWEEPFQTPEFDEYTLVISGKKQFTIDGQKIILNAGESIKINKNTRVQYANPFDEPVTYVSVCTPAFSLNLVHRENE